jgi:hypothetical protein
MEAGNDLNVAGHTSTSDTKSVITARDIGGRRLMRPAAPKPPTFFALAQRHIKRWHVLTAILAAASAIAATWTMSNRAAHIASLYAPHARLLAPYDHDRVLSDMGFSHQYSRVKPLGYPERGWWEWFIAMGQAQEAKWSGVSSDLAVFGEDLGDRFLMDGHEGYTRCATTAYALTTYFCGAQPASLVYALRDSGSGVAGLVNSISVARGFGAPFPQAVWHVSFGDSKEDNADLGHVFVLRLRPDGVLELLESYIQEYSLRKHLEGNSGAPRLLDKHREAAFLADLRTLEGSSGAAWQGAPQAAYKNAFGVLVPEDKVLGKVSVSFTVPCIVPPWNSSSQSVVVEEPRHFKAVLQLVHPSLWKASVTAGSFGLPGSRTETGAAYGASEDAQDDFMDEGFVAEATAFA